MVGSINRLSHEGLAVVSGSLYRFLNINHPWLDVETNEPIVNESGEAYHLVSPTKKPNLREIPFAFFPHSHLFFFDTKNIRPSMAREFLYNLFRMEDIVEKYGDVSVNVETSFDGINDILSLYSIKRLTISLTKPNPHGLSRFTSEVLEELEEQEAESLDISLKSKAPTGLKPNEKTKVYLYASTSLGNTEAVGRDADGKTQVVRTDEYPMTSKAFYNPDKQTYFNSFLGAAVDLTQRIINKT